MARRWFAYLFVAAIALLPIIRPFVANEVFVFRDHYDYFSPLRHFTAEELKSGHLPLWNPYNGSGERWLANPQTGVFYPPAWIFLVLPFSRAYLLFLGIHLIILATGVLWLFKRWMTTESAVMGSVLASLGGPALSLLDINNNLASLSWFPWIVNAALDLRQGRQSANILGPIFCALGFLGGEPVLAAVGAVTFVVLSLTGRPFSPRRAARVVVIGVVTILLVAVQLLPFLEMVAGSERIRGLPAGDAFANSLHPRDWLAIAVAPRAPGTAFVFLNPSQNYILSLYLGGFALVGLIGLVIGARSLPAPTRRVVLISLVALVAATAVAAGRFLPGMTGLMTFLHADVNRYPARFATFAALAVVALASVGLDLLKRFDSRKRMILAIATLSFAIASWFWFFPSAQRSALSWLTAIGSTLIIVLIVTAAPRLVEAKRWSYVLAAVAAVDLLSAAGPLLMSARWNPTSPHEQIIGGRARLIRLPERSISGQSRGTAAFEREQWLSGYLNLYLPRFDASTSAPVVSRNYQQLHDTALYGPRFDLLDFLSVKYLLTKRPLPVVGYRRVGSAGSVQVYSGETSLPMISMWLTAKSFSSDQAALRTVLSGSFDARREIAVSGSEQADDRPSTTASSLKARIFSSEISTRGVFVHLYTSGPILLTVNQLDAPGWSVELDGRAATSVRVNGLFRAIRIPPGTHHVAWSYHPAALKIGAILTAIGLVILALEAVVMIRMRQRAGGFANADG